MPHLKIELSLAKLLQRMNYRPFIILLVLSLVSNFLLAQENRAFDGSGNNIIPQRQQWGAAGEALHYRTTIAYEDGIQIPAGTSRVNPRIISNELFAQQDFLADRDSRSDMVWIFGQFIDHDITFVPGSVEQTDFLPIVIPEDDGVFQHGDLIPVQRSASYPGTGTDPANFRRTWNRVTSFIDASAVYGSDKEHADWLRTFEDGKLKTSKGNLLPWNTVTGELGDPVDPDAPEMEDQTFSRKYLFVAGDIRANENPLLLAMHTLFVREHNQICDQLVAEYPDWSDEEIYQKARKIVGAELQSIVYNEWLPAMGLRIRPYQGYDPEVNPSILNVFSAAAFRLGHTMINSTLLRVDNECEEIPAGHLSLKDVFFDPYPVLQNGLEPLFKGMCVQTAQRFDCRVVDDVRNFLFTNAGSPFKGMDLAAINIHRGRERGLADYNTIREDFGMNRRKTFEEICSDPEEAQLLESLYQTVDNVDPWVGMLAEDPMPNAMFGELVMRIMREQFSSLRDGDRFYFENDPGLTDREKDIIRDTRLYDILMRNTELGALQEEVFFISTCEDMEFAQIPVIKRELEFTVFPNPVENEFTIKLYSEEGELVNYRITDMMGRVIEEKELEVSAGFNRFDFYLDNSYITGIYQLTLFTENNSGQFRLVKQ